MKIFFTGDQHYFHKNIISACNRPFQNINEMHNVLISRHNEVVGKNDICYHVGDFTFLSNSNMQKVESVLKKLNGRNVLILGNHDPDKPHTLVNMGFESVHTSLILPEDNRFILNHDPAVSLIDRSKNFLVAHVHDLFVKEKNCLNVGVDIWNFYPISFKYIKEFLNIKYD